jgi:hypothetical protein
MVELFEFRIELNRTLDFRFGSKLKLGVKKIEPNYQAYFTVRKSNLKIFVKPDLLATIIRKPNICTILQKLFFNFLIFIFLKIENDYLEIIRLLAIESDNL